MTNKDCPVGAANKAKIEANEKRISELSETINKMMDNFNHSHLTLLEGMSNMEEEFDRKLERISERIGGRPSWAVMLILAGLSSLCIGLIVYMVKTN